MVVYFFYLLFDKIMLTVNAIGAFGIRQTYAINISVTKSIADDVISYE